MKWAAKWADKKTIFVCFFFVQRKPIFKFMSLFECVRAAIYIEIGEKIRTQTLVCRRPIRAHAEFYERFKIYGGFIAISTVKRGSH